MVGSDVFPVEISPFSGGHSLVFGGVMFSFVASVPMRWWIHKIGRWEDVFLDRGTFLRRFCMLVKDDLL